MNLTKKLIALALPLALAGCMLPGTYNIQQSTTTTATCPDGSPVQADGTCASQPQPVQPQPVQPVYPVQPTPAPTPTPVPAPYYDKHMKKELRKQQKEIECLKSGKCQPQPAPAPVPAPTPASPFIGGVTTPTQHPGFVGGVPTPHQAPVVAPAPHAPIVVMHAPHPVAAPAPKANDKKNEPVVGGVATPATQH